MKNIASLLMLTAAISLSAFAADSGSGRIHLDNAVKVGSTELPAGDYKVSWNGSGDNAQVVLKQGKTTATAAAQVVDVRRNAEAVGTKTENGTRVLTEIQFKDKTLKLQDSNSQSVGQ